LSGEAALSCIELESLGTLACEADDVLGERRITDLT
jgi:hypothetical protein